MQVRDDRVDGMITKLLEVRGKKPGKNVQLSEDDIKYLCTKSRELFMNQPNLLELEAPIKICGKFRQEILEEGNALSINNCPLPFLDGRAT